MTGVLKMSKRGVRVAAALVERPDGRHWGYELSRAANVRSGALYPMLRRMLEHGWLADGWETQPEADGRPPRRFYTVTPLGRQELWEYLGRAMGIGGSLALGIPPVGLPE